MNQTPVDAVEPLASAFERFGPAGAAVLGVLVVVGIGAWVGLKVHRMNLEHARESRKDLAVMLKTQRDELERMSDTCHGSHVQAREAFASSLELVVQAGDQRSERFEGVLQQVVDSNRRVEGKLVELIALQQRSV